MIQKINRAKSQFFKRIDKNYKPPETQMRERENRNYKYQERKRGIIADPTDIKEEQGNVKNIMLINLITQMNWTHFFKNTSYHNSEAGGEVWVAL